MTDEHDRLLTADDPLAQLHERCGGSLPGILAVPELLDLVQQGRRMGLRIAREFTAFDGEDMVSGYVRVRPLEEQEGSGCELLIENWQSNAAPEPNSRDAAERLNAIDRACAEVTARLDAQQRLQLFEITAGDGQELAKAFASAPATIWSEHVELKGLAHRQPLHWRLIDGATCKLPGSQREWRVRLLPLQPENGPPTGFELFLVADYPLDVQTADEVQDDRPQSHTQLIGGALTPVLRQPISRVIANAETIRARLAG
ncbi:MAG: sensor histidine kinase, partial [Pseudomonadota bacterium]